MQKIVIYQTATSVGWGNIPYYRNKVDFPITRMLLMVLEDDIVDAFQQINKSELAKILLEELDHDSGTVYSN